MITTETNTLKITLTTITLGILAVTTIMAAPVLIWNGLNLISLIG
jgi:hypothetical protein